ncbi:hypothetical protein LLH00_02125 [bacterium]|nr:hypothetical protein [bacterium]
MTRLQKLGLLYVCLLPIFAAAFLVLYAAGVGNQYKHALFIVIAVWVFGSVMLKNRYGENKSVPFGKLDELEREITLKSYILQFAGVFVYLMMIWLWFDFVPAKLFRDFVLGAFYFSYVFKGIGLLYYSRHLDRGRDIKLDQV